MARKNMFEGLTPAAPRDIKPSDIAPRAGLKAPEVFQQSGPIAAIRTDLRNAGARAVQDIDPAMIEDTGLKDRIGPLEDDILELSESIARHGQQVPILLRPHPRLSGRYQVVYGRRRLAAIKALGLPVKALIRTLTDEEAVLAQGQENNLRKDPSFIEKTLFAGELEEAGYEPRIIQDALNVSRSHTSHMRKVREAFPRPLIEKIGAAPSIGWKRWYEAASRLIEAGIDAQSVHPAPFSEGLTSDERFARWVAAFDTLLRAPARDSKVQARAIATPEGAAIGSVVAGGGKFTFRADPSTRDFADWLDANAEDVMRQMYTRFCGQISGGDA